MTDEEKKIVGAIHESPLQATILEGLLMLAQIQKEQPDNFGDACDRLWLNRLAEELNEKKG